MSNKGESAPVIKVFAFLNLFVLYPGAVAARVATLTYAWSLIVGTYPGLPAPNPWVVFAVLSLLGVVFPGSLPPEDTTSDASKITRSTGYYLGILIGCAAAAGYLWAAF